MRISVVTHLMIEGKYFITCFKEWMTRAIKNYCIYH